jgi:IS5 family transposase
MDGKLFGLSDYELITAKKRAKRERFLAEMEAVLPWQALIRPDDGWPHAQVPERD